MACPYPGPPCTTLKSPSSPGSFSETRGYKAGPSLSSDIAWERKHFNNPIVSSSKISARILDGNKKVLVTFKQATKTENALKNGYFFYNPVGLKNLDGKKVVIYELKENKRTYEFIIEIL